MRGAAFAQVDLDGIVFPGFILLHGNKIDTEPAQHAFITQFIGDLPGQYGDLGPVFGRGGK